MAIPKIRPKSRVIPFRDVEFLNQKDLRAYPGELYRCLIGMAETGKRGSCLPVAISKTIEAVNPELPCGDDTISVPLEALLSHRALETTPGSGGGYLVETDVASTVERVLRPASVVVKCGAQILPNLQGDLSLGRETAETTFRWLHELDTPTESSDTFGALNLTPHWLSGVTTLNKQLKIQSGVDISGFIIDSIIRGIGTAFDKAALQGSGNFGEPLGVFNRAGVNKVTFGGAATWAKAVNFERQVSSANVDDQRITFIADPATREKWRTIARFANASTALWQDDSTFFTNNCAGRAAYVTTNVPASSIVAGDFTKMILATWGIGSPLTVTTDTFASSSVQITVDPYAQKRSAAIEYFISLYGDCGVIREEAFCISTDSTTQ
jgi:HK97 family phage major capsid protein